jgi:putative PIN family toxin of toxin-antitoxin system
MSRNDSCLRRYKLAHQLLATSRLSGTTIDELRRKVLTKAYLQTRISPDFLYPLIELLVETAEIVSTSAEPVQQITRDSKDDYLLSQSILSHVDFLISGDHDLLVIGEISGVLILSPADFIELLEHQTD